MDLLIYMIAYMIQKEWRIIDKRISDINTDSKYVHLQKEGYNHDVLDFYIIYINYVIYFRI